MHTNAWQTREMHRVLTKLAILLIVTIGCVFGAARDDERLTKAAEKVAASKRILIKGELEKSLEHPWAGNYYTGDGLGTNIRLAIAPHEGFVFEDHGCLGVYDRNLGSVSEKNGRLSLSFHFTNGPRSVLAQEFVTVRWGERRYLVPAAEMPEFCDAVNRGREPRKEMHGMFLLREGDEKLRVNAFPEVPPEYRKLLSKHRVDGQIVGLGGTTKRGSTDGAGFLDTKVVMDIGTHDGVRAGMIFYVVKPHGSAESVEVLSVSTNRSDGVMTQNGRDAQRPKVGWRVSTKPW